jgi:hypothetical protein
VFRIEIETAEDLVLEPSEANGQVLSNQFNAGELWITRHLSREELQCGGDDAIVVDSAIATINLPIQI